jgi:hypothetical protein
MTTTTTQVSPVTPPPTTTASFISHWVTFVKAHEKLLLSILLAAVLWHVGDKIYDAYGKHLQAVQVTDNAKIAQIDKQNAQTALDLAQLKATVAANAVLNQAKVVVAKQKLATQQKINETLPLPQLSEHWQSLLSLPPNSITPQPNGTVAVTTDAAHLTVNALETIPALNVQLTASQDDLKGCTSVRAEQDTTIAGLNTKIAAEVKGRSDDQKAAKHNIRSAYLHGLKHGLIIGVPVGVALTIAAIIH